MARVSTQDHTGTNDSSKWIAVIARSVAYLCLNAQHPAKKGIVERADFLEGLGLSLREAAFLLDSSEASIRELRRRARSTKTRGRKRADKKATSKQR